MRRRPPPPPPPPPSSSSDGQTGSPSADVERSRGKIDTERSAVLCFTMFVLFLYGSWEVYRFHYHRLPVPLTASQAGKRGFSEELAMKHVKALTGFGPRPVGSDSLDRAVQYVLEASENIKRTAHWEVDVEVDLFHSKSGANLLVGGMFKGKTLIYSNMKHVVVRILPKYLPEAEENMILVSSHIDTVFSTEGAGDCSSCVGVMLELARGVSQWAHGFKGGIIFLFNTGEEEGLNGAHSFITQHPWRHAVRFFVDLEAIGVGGKSSIFQSGSAFWPLETFARVAKYPSAQVVSQDLFLSGALKSATDFQVYEEVGGLPGLDFAYTDLSAVYHTKNDKLKFLKPGSLQHLGENMLPFLIQSAMSSDLSKDGAVQDKDRDRPVFFDILGTYMVAYRQSSASVVQKTVILQALLLWSGSLFVGGYQAIIATGLSFLGIILMWIFSLILSILVAFLLPLVCEHPAPYISNPWLIIGLFGAPAVVGALAGQHLGFHILHNYLCYVSSKRQLLSAKHVDILKLESERWLFKAGFLQWLIVLVLGSYFKAGSSYIALIWLISPAFFYGLMEATLTPARSPRKLKIITLLFGLTVPILISAGGFIRLGEFIAGSTVRFDRNPGTTPVWLGNLIVAIFVVTVVCLLFVYLLSYFHLSVFRGKSLVIISMCFIFFLSLAGVSFKLLPAFSNDVARAVNVVHVVDASGSYEENLDPVSFVTIFSTTPGKLGREMDILKDEDFSCGTNHVVDFVTFYVNHSCWSLEESTNGWSKLDIPILKVEHDYIAEVRKTHVLIDTKSSTRWFLAINSDQVEGFSLEASSDDLLSVDLKTEGEGWHIIQFSGGKDSPTKFMLTLSWKRNETRSSKGTINPEKSQPLLKLRTDLSTITPKTARVLEKLPSWCSLFGKSTSPHTLAFLTSLPLEF